MLFLIFFDVFYDVLKKKIYIIVFEKISWFFDEKNDLFMNSDGQEKHQKIVFFLRFLCFKNGIPI